MTLYTGYWPSTHKHVVSNQTLITPIAVKYGTSMKLTLKFCRETALLPGLKFDEELELTLNARSEIYHGTPNRPLSRTLTRSLVSQGNLKLKRMLFVKALAYFET